MKTLFVLLPILVLALFESTIAPFHLTLLAVICWSVLQPGREGLLVAFFSGLILDFLTGRTLGLTSLVFLSLSLLIYFYKNRFQANRLAFLLPFTFGILMLVDVIWGVFTPSIMTVVKNGVNTSLIIFLFPIFNFLAKVSEKEQLKLSL